MERNVTVPEAGGLAGAAACLVFHQTDVHETHRESLKARKYRYGIHLCHNNRATDIS